MLVISRRDLAANLASYGEAEASARILEMPDPAYERVCQIGFKHALSGMHFMKAGCLAAIEVMEGAPRKLKRDRRDWANVPLALLESDPIAVAVHQEFDRYGAGERVLKKEIVATVAQALAPALKDFRFFKSAGQFRGPFDGGVSYISLEYAKMIFALRFGVRLEKIESLKSRLFGLDTSRPANFPSTISKYSYNMGPHRQQWPYPTRTTWPISGSEGLRLACKEIKDFVLETVVPYVLLHREPLAIRSTLMHEPERADGWFSIDATVFAIDFACRKREWLVQDYEVLRERFAKFVQPKRDEFESRYQTITARWNDAI